MKSKLLALTFGPAAPYDVRIMVKALRKKAVYQYTAVFEPDAEAGGYTVTIPSLPGCISEGDTFEQAFANIREAAALYLEVMRERRQDISTEELGVIVAPVRVQTKV